MGYPWNSELHAWGAFPEAFPFTADHHWRDISAHPQDAAAGARTRSGEAHVPNRQPSSLPQACGRPFALRPTRFFCPSYKFLFGPADCSFKQSHYGRYWAATRLSTLAVSSGRRANYDLRDSARIYERVRRHLPTLTKITSHLIGNFWASRSFFISSRRVADDLISSLSTRQAQNQSNPESIFQALDTVKFAPNNTKFLTKSLAVSLYEKVSIKSVPRKEHTRYCARFSSLWGGTRGRFPAWRETNDKSLGPT